jgi:hypothetical protein
MNAYNDCVMFIITPVSFAYKIWSFALSEVFENIALRRKFCPQKEEVT